MLHQFQKLVLCFDQEITVGHPDHKAFLKVTFGCLVHLNLNLVLPRLPLLNQFFCLLSVIHLGPFLQLLHHEFSDFLIRYVLPGKSEAIAAAVLDLVRSGSNDKLTLTILVNGKGHHGHRAPT